MNRSKQRRPPAVNGQYNRNGYEIWCNGQAVYSAGNHAQDSTQPALCMEDRLPLRTVRRFCIQTAQEVAREQNGTFASVERVADLSQGGGQRRR
jgi:hypothetical protein